jgi:acetylornithine deacetylase/succinyl-diaminopimelate desuccinylase-like protein
VLADTGPVDGDGPTVLVYGHYDVQPAVDESLWDSPPFEPIIRNESIFARGAADDKGQILTHLLAAENWVKVAGKSPVRVKFMIEGEEEIGSPNLEPLLREHAKRLACDYIVLSDTPKLNAETPAITYGTKGLVYKEIYVRGPKQDLHSGSFGGTVTNPGNALARIIASLRDEDNRITIPGFYDNIVPLTSAERARMAELPFDVEGYRELTGSPSLSPEKGFSPLECRWARPTLDVNGIVGGFIGEGASTIIPAQVRAKVSMRLVPGQDYKSVSQSFDNAVKAAAPQGVTVEIRTYASCGAYLADTNSVGMAAALRAMEAGFGKAPVFMREGGTLPILPLFKDVLGADSLMLGFCMPDCNAHGPNEYFTLRDLHEGTRTAAYFLHELARSH